MRRQNPQNNTQGNRSRYWRIVSGGVMTLGAVMLVVTTLWLILLDGGFLPYRGVFRQIPEPQPDVYALIDTDNPNADSDWYDWPWYTVANPHYRCLLGSTDCPGEVTVPAAVYSRGANTLDVRRHIATTRRYNTLRWGQFGGVALVLLGGVGMMWPRRARRKIQIEKALPPTEE